MKLFFAQFFHKLYNEITNHSYIIIDDIFIERLLLLALDNYTALDFFSTTYRQYVRRFFRFQIPTKRLIHWWIFGKNKACSSELGFVSFQWMRENKTNWWAEFISDYMLYFMCVNFLCEFNRWKEADGLFRNAIEQDFEKEVNFLAQFTFNLRESIFQRRLMKRNRA